MASCAAPECWLFTRWRRESYKSAPAFNILCVCSKLPVHTRGFPGSYRPMHPASFTSFMSSVLPPAECRPLFHCPVNKLRCWPTATKSVCRGLPTTGRVKMAASHGADIYRSRYTPAALLTLMPLIRRRRTTANWFVPAQTVLWMWRTRRRRQNIKPRYLLVFVQRNKTLACLAGRFVLLHENKKIPRLYVPMAATSASPFVPAQSPELHNAVLPRCLLVFVLVVHWITDRH